MMTTTAMTGKLTEIRSMNKRAEEEKRNEGMDECTATIAAER